MIRPTLAQLQALPKAAPYGPNSRLGMPWLFAYQGGAASPHWSGLLRSRAGELIAMSVYVPRSWLLKRRSDGNRSGASNA